jgi:hypothetical protein
VNALKHLARGLVVAIVLTILMWSLVAGCTALGCSGDFVLGAGSASTCPSTHVEVEIHGSRVCVCGGSRG